MALAAPASTRSRLALLLTPLAIGFLAGCGSGASSHGSLQTLRVTERDFRIVAPKHAHAGEARLVVDNEGPDAHELIVVRTQDGRLPMRADGMTIDEDAVERATVGLLEPGAPGSVREVRIQLAPGRYVLFCNMSGHFMGGMTADLVVA